jgi:hypothetical protein
MKFSWNLSVHLVPSIIFHCNSFSILREREREHIRRAPGTVREREEGQACLSPGFLKMKSKLQ